ncbi:type II toxin-antitoxin system HicA family toxin [Clavibacter sepedonicus]|uniref:Uncharacterized protein n=1 Tax=Clavibacter sepedonicus TaxID=31964 RepID=B0RIZ8_CLASE|nr:MULTISPECIES: type II toxin-antitoxin system HicA family toxin [Clavibacter]MBD5382682.1 type II toxin-antitoxin system HicA family toxin [Clavibacter sp.]OQJ45056.1 toxin HicA [Clavibacter sepedonicus]OQJ50921.1 toxin HicA [Clavibacter sepedonicus]UUK67276.1 type II toxin-antitoxin system HicA family toxin [Clavibacter sepedonicus]CAQ03186.1 hypothetical protein pCS0003 [Clavibacter sepedonicus]
MKPQKSRDVKKHLRAAGWVYIRDAKGSHEVWGTSDGSVTLPVPFGHKEITPGVLAQLEAKGVAMPEGWK